MSSCNVDILRSLFIVVSDGGVCLTTVFHCSSSDFLAKKHGLYTQQLAQKKRIIMLVWTCLILSNNCVIKTVVK